MHACFLFIHTIYEIGNDEILVYSSCFTLFVSLTDAKNGYLGCFEEWEIEDYGLVKCEIFLKYGIKLNWIKIVFLRI